MTTVSVFGGTGFLGRRLVRRLAGEGASVRVAVRSPERARNVLPDPDHVQVLRADVRDPASVAAAVAGADAVVNAVSAYVEKAGVSFESVHVQGARTLAQEAFAAGVARLVLVSGIGADPESASPYIRARGRGELAARQAFPGATVVRPGAMFGPGDALFGALADIVRLSPVVPLIGGGRTRVQPVYVEDVAEAIARVLAERGSAGQTYELAGPGAYTLRELVGFVLRLRGADSDDRRLEILDLAGLAANAQQPARLLSGGEQQRLALARALATEPEVLFLDEPTSSLDPGSVAIIEDMVKSIHAGGTKVLFVTHDIGQARRLADEVLFIHRGQVVEHTPVARFFDNPDSRPAQDYLAGRIVR